MSVMKVILLGLTVVFGAVFLVIPANNNPPVYPLFPLASSEDTISIQAYVYFIFEHFQLMALCYIIAAEAKVYRLSCQTFFWLQVADFADYLLTYNAVWFNMGTLPVSMNLMKIAIFGMVAMYDYHRESMILR